MSGVLALVAARGGSKGLPRKNILPLGGRPLISWTIRAALAARCVARVIVSTDDAEIAAVAREAGADVPFLRPAELASDDATSAAVVAHALEAIPGYDRAVLLQPTSPFRTAADIDSGHALWLASGASACVSVCAAGESPWLMYCAAPDGRLKSLLPEPPGGLRRQDLPKALVLNGAFYFLQTHSFLHDRRLVREDSIGFEMTTARSVDIDTEGDFAAAERQLSAWAYRLPEDAA